MACCASASFTTSRSSGSTSSRVGQLGESVGATVRHWQTPAGACGYQRGLFSAGNLVSMGLAGLAWIWRSAQ
jgi:hypothetical protein